jgi:hypothetical protein
MSTKTSKLSKATAANASKNDEKEDLAALIYRESQLRKKVAASDATDRAKTRKRSTTASTRRSTSTRQATAGCRDTTSDEMITRRTSLKRKRDLCGDDAEQEVSTNVARKKYRYECSADGCTNQSQKGGVCMRHGAKVKVKLCSSEGCTNHVVNGGVCKKHGAKVKLCSNEGCTNKLRKEECALGMGQRSNDAAVKDAQIKSSKEECAGGMGHTIIPMMNLLHSDTRTDLHMMKRL